MRAKQQYRVAKPPAKPQSLIEREERGEENTLANTLKNDLRDCLENVQSTGSFAYNGVFQNVASPGLNIKSIGLVGLPLSDRDAKTIAALSHHASLEKGSEMIDDVGKTWEFAPADFSLTNPAWNDFMNSSMVKNVGKGLGMEETDFKLELHRLSLCNQGAVFKPHHDSEKGNQVLGTLVIALPSKHEGNEVQITSDGRQVALDTSKTSEFQYSFSTWYSDVVRKAQPITSGSLLVLTYTLIRTVNKWPRSAAGLAGHNRQLQSIISQWKSELPDAPESLAYVFRNRYADANLSYNLLKGHDAKVALHLKKVCEKLGFYFCLANCQLTVEGDCDSWSVRSPDSDGENGYDGEYDYHSITEETERSLELTVIVQLDGKKVSEQVDARDGFPHFSRHKPGRIKYDEDCIIQNDPFASFEPAENFSHLPTYNRAGVAPTTTQHYDQTVAVIMPSSLRIGFFLRKRGRTDVYHVREIELWFDRLFKIVATNPASKSSQEAQEELREICELIISDTQEYDEEWRTDTDDDRPYPEAVMSRVVKAALELDDCDIFMRAFKLIEVFEAQIPLYCEAGTMLRRHGELEIETISELEELQGFTDQCEALFNLRKGFLGDDTQGPAASMPAFFVEQLQLAIGQWNLMSAANGVLLVRAAELQIGQPGDIFDNIIANVKENAQWTPMALAFLAEMMNAASGGKIPKDDAHTGFKCLIKEVIQNFSLKTINFDKAAPKEKEQKSYWMNNKVPEPEAPEIAIARQAGENIASLLHHCLHLGLHDELGLFLDQVISHSRSLHVDAFNGLLLPLSKHLLKISPRSSPYREVIREILSNYVIRYIQEEPSVYLNWARKPLGCGCQHCHSLDRFLANPEESEKHFKIAESGRDHIQSRTRSGNNISTKIEYTGSPYTLVLVKNRLKNPEHKSWKERVVGGSRLVRELGSEGTLKALLGDIFVFVWNPDACGLKKHKHEILSNVPAPAIPHASASHSSGSRLGTASAARVNQVSQPLGPIVRKRPASHGPSSTMPPAGALPPSGTASGNQVAQVFQGHISKKRTAVIDISGDSD